MYHLEKTQAQLEALPVSDLQQAIDETGARIQKSANQDGHAMNANYRLRRALRKAQENADKQKEMLRNAADEEVVRARKVYAGNTSDPLAGERLLKALAAQDALS